MKLDLQTKEYLKKIRIKDMLEGAYLENTSRYKQFYLYELAYYFKVAILPLELEIEECDRIINSHQEKPETEFIIKRLGDLKIHKKECQKHIQALKEMAKLMSENIDSMGLTDNNKEYYINNM